MQRIKFITDSSSDLTHEWAQAYDIDILPMGINIAGKPYHEGVDFTNEEFYRILATEKELPTTSAINTTAYYDAFERHYLSGRYDRLVVVTVGSALSSSFTSAQLARQGLYEHYPEAAGKLEIDIYDSGSASAGYGYPIMCAIDMLRSGEPYAAVQEFFEDWFASFEVYFVAFSFDIVKRSGRVNAPTAYIGEKLGIRPLMQNTDGVFRPFGKVRGDANVPKKLLQIAKERMRPGSPYLFLNGTQPNVAEETAALFEREFGASPAKVFQPGPAMVVNAGPKMFCIGFLGERRR